ncbi:MAG: hypothetical protein ACPGU0_00400 [Marinirhabdus sp.]
MAHSAKADQSCCAALLLPPLWICATMPRQTKLRAGGTPHLSQLWQPIEGKRCHNNG